LPGKGKVPDFALQFIGKKPPFTDYLMYPDDFHFPCPSGRYIFVWQMGKVKNG
jgi:hypothetical protein